MDVHEHNVRAEGEDALDRLRATAGEADDLIPQAAELTSDVQRRNVLVLDNQHSGGWIHGAAFTALCTRHGEIDGRHIRALPVATGLVYTAPT